MSLGRAFVLLLVINAGIGSSPAFAVERLPPGLCLPAQKRVCTLGPPAVCHCTEGPTSRSRAVNGVKGNASEKKR
jgi:hypothetical protein